MTRVIYVLGLEPQWVGIIEKECGSVEEILKMEEEAGRILGNDCTKQEGM